MADKKAIGQSIKAFRLDLKGIYGRAYTQAACASRYRGGRSQSRWADIEAGRTEITLPVLVDVFKALGARAEIRVHHGLRWLGMIGMA